MGEFLRQHWAYLIGALLLHVLFAGVFGLTLVSISRQPPPAQLAIQAVVVDQSVLNRANRRQQREREAEQQRAREQAAAEQRRQEQQEQERREAEQRTEQEHQAELKQREQEEQRRQAEEQQLRERQETERKQAVEAERKRVEEIERKQREAAEKRKAAEEARVQAARQEELRSQLEEEEGLMRAESSAGNKYTAMIQQQIERNWNRPPSARPGLECEVRVAQAPGGTVLSVQLGRCNGDAAVKQSIEAAVMRASPLPPPPDPRLFERNLVLIFKPLD
jgi:colicin import membrane protein